MIRALGNDSFLEDIHALMLMDDTVLLASTRLLIFISHKLSNLMKQEGVMQRNSIEDNLYTNK